MENHSPPSGYGIGAVSRLTGLPAHTLRIWERRYGAVRTFRSPGGRRYYSDEDVARLTLLKQLTDKGVAISKVARKSNAALRAALLEYDRIATKATPETIRVAVLGELVLAKLMQDPAALEIAVADSNAETFCADLEHQPVDVVILETTIADAEALKQLRSYLSLGRAGCGLIVYNFGRKADIDRATGAGFLTLRAPVSATDIQSAIHNRLVGGPKPAPVTREQAKTSSNPDWQFSDSIPQRRFTRQQLVRLANISSTIDCECPQNLAQLVSDLTAFEVYSAQCANRDAEDAALHQYLHQTCAQARELIEIALKKVIDAEGISV